MELPKFTRLRYVKTREIDQIQKFLELIGSRVQIYGSPVWTGTQWVLWFVPDDRSNDVNSIDLDG
jgi:hypothetical protein